MSFNRFITDPATTETTAALGDAPVAETETTTETETLDSIESNEVDPVTGKKTRKASKPRDKKNSTITKEQKNEMLKRYASETPAAIAADMGLESRQVYNVIRNTRIKLMDSIKVAPTNTPEEIARKEKLEAALAKIPTKESTAGVAGGSRANTMTEDDIIASLLG